MNNSILLELIKEWYKNFIPDDLLRRDFDYSMLDFKNKALILMGLRRTGKSYLMFQIINHLFNSKKIPKSNLIYINFEDDRILFPDLSILTDLLGIIKNNFEISKEHPLYLFLDEIQIIKSWEKWARRILDKEKDVRLIITGSSSKVLPSNIASAMRGRSVPYFVYPLSFSEFKRFRNKPAELIADKNWNSTADFSFNAENSFLKLVKKDLKMEYLFWGGMPEIAFIEDERKKIIVLQEYFDAIVNKEIKSAREIDNPAALDMLIKLFVSNFSSLASISKLHKVLKSAGVSINQENQPENPIKVGKGTLIEYQSYIKEAFFMDFIEKISNSIKDRLQYPKKVYIADNGFIRALSGKIDLEPGKLLENLVFNELKRQGNRDIFYYKEKKECDFLTRNLLQAEQAIQATWDLNSENYKREKDGLLDAMNEFNLDEGIILVNANSMGKNRIEEKIGNKIKKIDIVSVWDWMG